MPGWVSGLDVSDLRTAREAPHLPLAAPLAGQLTEKSHKTEFIGMTPEQQSLYDEAVKSMRSQITGKAAAAAADTSEKGVSRRVLSKAVLISRLSWQA